MIPSLLSILVAAALIQEPTVDGLVRSLGSDDIAVREKATAELLKTPLDKLDLLAKHLKSVDAETEVRLRIILTKVLGSSLGTRTAKFELRALADPAIQDAWVAAGADPKKPPKGYEVRRYHPRTMDPTEERAREWVLVGSACVTDSDVKNARAAPDQQSAYWQVSFELFPEGAKRFDEVAAVQHAKDPKGKLAIVLDGLILSAPMVQTNKFEGQGVIFGRFSETEARQLAKALRGESMEPFMRAVKERETADAPEKVAESIRGMKGADHLTLRVDGAEVDISGLIDSQDLLSVWLSLRVQGYRLVPKK